VEQVRNLSLEAAKLGYPVRLCGVVTHFNAKEGDLFVQDATAGIYVNLSNFALRFKPGRLVEVEGVTGAPDFAPEISRSSIRF
jgi:hypothetical protein